jgi:aminoglycoside phosphotransferase (APT) family kinase protein
MNNVSDLVMHMLKEQFGSSPHDLETLTTGQSSSAVFAATLGELPKTQVVVKLNDNPKILAGLERNLLALSDLGLSVPAVLGSDMSLERYPFAFVILERIPGTDLRHELSSMTVAQMTTLAAQIVDFQRRVATLELGDGFGWRPLGEVGAFSSWYAVVQRDLEEGNSRLETLGELTLMDQIIRRCQALEMYFWGIKPTCFLDDLTTKNVIVQHGQLRGLVDFDVVCYGDPLYWLALTRAAVLVDVGDPGVPYLEALEELWNMDDLEQEALRIYTAIHLMNFARFETDTEKLEQLLQLIRTNLKTK